MAKDIKGKHGSRKISIPSVLNLSLTDARNAITAAGLTYTDESTSTGTSSDNQKVFQQTPEPGTVVLLGSNVLLKYYTYVVPPFFPYFPPFFPYFPPAFPYFPPAFPPFFPDFPPPPAFPYFKAGKTGCIGKDTLILKNNNEYIKAKNIKVGDTILTVNPKNFSNEQINISSLASKIDLVEINVISVKLSIKDVYGINKEDAYFSGSQPIFIKDENNIKYINMIDLKIGDIVISIGKENVITETVVESINKIENYEVYDIRTEPYQWFIAGNHLVIS